MYEVACLVDAGVGSKENDDRVVIGDRVVDNGTFSKQMPIAFAAVCDGVGGELFGNEAAQIVAACFSEAVPETLDIAQIAQRTELANARVLAAQKQDRFHAKMASTVAGIVVNGNDCIAFNVGDSRVYRYRAPYIAQLTTDHSVEEEMRALGLEPKEEQAHIITRFMGSKAVKPDIIDGTNKAFADDMYIICSDGVSDVIDDIELEEFLSKDLSLEDMCKEIVAAAIAKGSEDNLSVILIKGM